MSEHRPPFELPAPDLGRWREGNTGVEGVWRFESGLPGREVLVTALVHGNEVCGAWAVKAALDAGLRPKRGALTFAFANLAAFDRFDPAADEDARCVDQDMNRLWGAMPWRAEGRLNVERERVLQLLPVVERADWLLDLHSMSNAGPPLVLTGMQERHIALAREIGSPALVVADAGHAEGCRMRDHGRFADSADNGTRSLLVECGFHGEWAAREVAKDLLGRFLVASGSIDESALPAAWPLQRPPRQQVLEVTHAIACAEGEPPMFAAPWRTGQTLPEAGTLLGWNGGQPLRTPYEDCTLIMPSVRRAKPGQTIVRLARRRA